MYYPTLKEARELARDGDIRSIPVAQEMLSDFITPIQALRILRSVSNHCFLLESTADSEHWGRYTFLGFEPKLEVTCKDGVLRTKNGRETSEQVHHPAERLRELMAEYKSPRIEGLPPFTGGLVGYFSYDYLKYAEPTLKLDAKDREQFQDLDLMLFDKVIVFDNYRQKIILVANADAADLDESYPRACAELQRMADLLRSGTPAQPMPGRLTTPLEPLYDLEQYKAMIRRAKEYIREGDIFQVVLSNRLEAGFEGSLLDTYRMLRTTNPSPYMFFFTSDQMELAGASPETLVKLEDGVLHTFPLAGTRPRGQSDVEDRRLEADLRADAKELAEHNMLVDLGRNDLGKVCEIGSVEVETYQDVLRFSHVMHIGSTVRGQLREDRDALDALEAVLPAGTLSGAPKIRAMEIINELEDDKRGVYGGAVGYLDFAGNMDTCIAIRLAYTKNGKVFVRSGGGIVADSEPETEYKERVNKARAVVEALEEASEGTL